MMSEIDNQMESVSYTRKADGNAEEYDFLTPLYEKCRNVRKPQFKAFGILA